MGINIPINHRNSFFKSIPYTSSFILNEVDLSTYNILEIIECDNNYLFESNNILDKFSYKLI